MYEKRQYCYSAFMNRNHTRAMFKLNELTLYTCPYVPLPTSSTNSKIPAGSLKAERSISSKLRAGESLAMSTSSRERWTKTTPKLFPWKFHLGLFHSRPHAAVAPEARGPASSAHPGSHSARSRSSERRSSGSGSPT